MRQPWAWAIVHGGKDVENRTRNVAGSYRGPVAIHAGLAPDTAAQGGWPVGDLIPMEAWRIRGAFVGVVDLVDVHSEFACTTDSTSWCSPWAQTACPGSHGSGADCPALHHPMRHLVLANPRPLPEPIPARGILGLWTPEPAVVEQLQAVV